VFRNGATLAAFRSTSTLRHVPRCVDIRRVMKDAKIVCDAEQVTRLRAAYLDLVCNSLVGRLNRDPPLQQHLSSYDDEHRMNGWDWPSGAPSMIGWRRMAHLRNECERVIAQHVPGDLLEAGVWRGGATIMMRAVLEAYDVRERKVIAADTFSGMPADSDPNDTAAFLRHNPVFAVSLDEVKGAFYRYGLLDDRVVFLQGAFADTLKDAAIDRLAILRLDGDTYASARATLQALYDKLSPGGTVILDDYFLFNDNKRAIDEFRAERGIADPIVRIDDYGGYWVRDSRGRAPD